MRIVELREELGLTQEKLAWEAGLQSKSYLSRIESGERLPSVDVLEKLARRLDVEPRDLLTFPGRSTLDRAMDAIRLGGAPLAQRVLELAKVETANPRDRPKRRVVPRA